MSSPRFIVFKLKDLKIPILILLIALVLFLFLLFKNKSAAQTFAPSDTYQDGKYIAGILLSDADMDLVVEVKDRQIASVSLEGLDESASTLYKDLVSGIDYVNTYVTATQSLELPLNANTTAAANMLMDAVKVALLNEEGTQISSTYEKINLTTNNDSADIWVDEFDPNSATETTDENLTTPVTDSEVTDSATEPVASEAPSVLEENISEN